MLIPVLATLLRVIMLIEFPYVRRHHVKPARNWDKHSAKLWDAANLLEPVGMVLGFAGIGRMHAADDVIGLLGLLCLVAGITIRWTAIYTLGKYFTGTVLIKTDHQLVRTGPYRYVRHPAYAGALLAHFGLGLAFANWFSLAFSSIPFLMAAFYRMRVEERALREAFGAEYADYAQATRRLVPGLY